GEVLAPGAGAFHLALDQRPVTAGDVEALGRGGETDAEAAQALGGAAGGRAGQARLGDAGVEGGRGQPGGAGAQAGQPFADARVRGHQPFGGVLGGRAAGAGAAHGEGVRGPAHHQEGDVLPDVRRGRGDLGHLGSHASGQPLRDRLGDPAGVAVHGFVDDERVHGAPPAQGRTGWRWNMPVTSSPGSAEASRSRGRTRPATAARTSRRVIGPTMPRSPTTGTASQPASSMTTATRFSGSPGATRGRRRPVSSAPTRWSDCAAGPPDQVVARSSRVSTPMTCRPSTTGRWWTPARRISSHASSGDSSGVTATRTRLITWAAVSSGTGGVFVVMPPPSGAGAPPPRG